MNHYTTSRTAYETSWGVRVLRHGVYENVEDVPIAPQSYHRERWSAAYNDSWQAEPSLPNESRPEPKRGKEFHIRAYPERRGSYRVIEFTRRADKRGVWVQGVEVQCDCGSEPRFYTISWWFADDGPRKCLSCLHAKRGAA